MFCSENYNHNSKSEDNFFIRSGNEIEKVLPRDYFSKIPSGIDTPSPPQGNSPLVIPSGIISAITMGNNSNIPSGHLPPITPRDMSKILEDTIAATYYKSMSSAPTEYKVHLIDPDLVTIVKPNSKSTPNPIPNLKLSNSKNHQQICSHIFNDKQEPRDLKM